MRESADLLGQYTDTLADVTDGGGRSPWGNGVIGMAMDQINEMVGQACRHLHTNLGELSAGIQAMADRHQAAEADITAVLRSADRNMDASDI